MTILSALRKALGLSRPVPEPVRPVPPASVIDHPSMMSADEKALLFDLASRRYRGHGLIVDAGVFLGASTVAFAEGLRRNARLNTAALSFKPIRSYDVALWVASMNRHLKSAKADPLRGLIAKDPQPGETFEPLLRRIIEPYSDLVDLRVGDIRKTLVCDRPVEIAFLDCMKSFSIDQTVFRRMYGHLEVGSVVVQQDYFYDRALDLKIRQEFLADFFSFEQACGGSAVFSLRKPVPADLIASDPVQHLTNADKASLLRNVERRASTDRQKLYAMLAVVNFHLGVGDGDSARQAMREADRFAGTLEPAALKGRIARSRAEIRGQFKSSGGKPV